MKKILLTTALLLSITINAQKDRWGKIKSLKVAFITEQLNLTEKESQEFWTVYNTFEEASSEIRFKEMRAIRKEIRENLDSMSDEEAIILIKKLNDAENRMYKLKMELSQKLSKIISAKKIIKLKVAEDDFKKKMMEEFKKRRYKGGE